MKVLSAVMNIARMPSVARRSYYTISTIRSCSASKTRTRTTCKGACGTSRVTRMKTTARTRAKRNSTITDPSFFFEINGNREVS